MADDVAKLRAWAEGQLAALKRQREGIDRKAAEFEGFLAILGQAKILHGEVWVEIPAKPNGNGSITFPARVADMLRQRAEPMNAAQITEALRVAGYKYSGKIPLKVMVATELARQSKKNGHGIRKVETGLYTAT